MSGRHLWKRAYSVRKVRDPEQRSRRPAIFNAHCGNQKRRTFGFDALRFCDLLPCCICFSARFRSASRVDRADRRHTRAAAGTLCIGLRCISSGLGRLIRRLSSFLSSGKQRDFRQSLYPLPIAARCVDGLLYVSLSARRGISAALSERAADGRDFCEYRWKNSGFWDIMPGEVIRCVVPQENRTLLYLLQAWPSRSGRRGTLHLPWSDEPLG